MIPINKFIISITPIINTDNTITIETNNPDSFYKLVQLKLNWNLLFSNTKNIIALHIKYDLSSKEFSNNIIRSGQLISIDLYNSQSRVRQTIFKGFISSIQLVRDNGNNGTMIYLMLDQTIGQLNIISSNNGWNDVLYKYNTIMDGFTGNTVEFKSLLKNIALGTIISNISDGFTGPLKDATYFNLIDGLAPPIPNNIWAVCVPNKSRDAVLREVLYPYNRIFWQTIDGTPTIQPLFFNDKADDIWSLDIQKNNGFWINWAYQDNNATLINRVDTQFAISLPLDPYTTDPNIRIGNNIFSSAVAPKQYYPRLNNLYETGKWTSAKMVNLALDNSLLLDASLINSFNLSTIDNVITYGSNLSANKQTVPKIYSANEISTNIIGAYSLKVLYDYNKMQSKNGFYLPPLSKIITINSYGLLEYESMLCYNASLNLSNNTNNGLTLEVDYCPLNCITGVWYNK